ncbi:KEOPS complex subunit Cgi121 [Halostagnicola sp. A-GB9-2]|uniref:KEOPS complex subunit Cgi121 n=1 Tax=Halostagnicola sp. A-GB9-2 TaxID=3048066 RepID=UPI0024BF8C05|nr:KEOPS complex subunit Cgi121 [Halostagnicola sp. A-GB9-2]MDJ1432793.1 KEOPS complex subunit Cgi121 [Halostagnicola sp. A-GB9-2]
MELLEGRLELEDLDAFVARLGELGDRHGVTIQAFDASYIAGERHLERSIELADRARERGENVARDRAVEILLYAAGRRQIDRALEMGVSEGGNRVVVLFDAGGNGEGSGDDRENSDSGESGETRARKEVIEAEQFDPEPTLEGPNEETLQSYFDITSAEREATDAGLEDLVCERVALLEVEK